MSDATHGNAVEVEWVPTADDARVRRAQTRRRVTVMTIVSLGSAAISVGAAVKWPHEDGMIVWPALVSLATGWVPVRWALWRVRARRAVVQAPTAGPYRAGESQPMQVRFDRAGFHGWVAEPLRTAWEDTNQVRIGAYFVDVVYHVSGDKMLHVIQIPLRAFDVTTMARFADLITRVRPRFRPFARTAVSSQE